MTTHPLPDLSLQHALFTARAAGRSVGWANRLTRAHPGAFAVLLWVLWAVLGSLSRTAAAAALEITFDSAGQPARDSTGHLLQRTAVEAASLGGPASVGATLAWLAAVVFTFGAVAAFVSSLASEPTHRVGADGRPRRVKGRHTSMARRRNGRYLRLRVRRSGVARDWRDAKRDARFVDRRLSRLGTARQRTWDQIWAVEDANLAERSQMGTLDRIVTRQAKPKGKGGKPAEVKKVKKVSKAARRALEAEFDGQVAEINGRRTARAQALLIAAPRPGVDAAAPLVAPGSTAGTGPEQVEWAARAGRAHNDAARFVAKLQGLHTNGHDKETAVSKTTGQNQGRELGEAIADATRVRRHGLGCDCSACIVVWGPVEERDR